MGRDAGFIDAPVAARSRAEISADDGAGTVGGESQSDSAAEPGGGASDHGRARREAVGKKRAHHDDWRRWKKTEKGGIELEEYSTCGTRLQECWW